MIKRFPTLIKFELKSFKRLFFPNLRNFERTCCHLIQLLSCLFGILHPAKLALIHAILKINIFVWNESKTWICDANHNWQTGRGGRGLKWRTHSLSVSVSRGLIWIPLWGCCRCFWGVGALRLGKSYQRHIYLFILSYEARKVTQFVRRCVSFFPREMYAKWIYMDAM